MIIKHICVTAGFLLAAAMSAVFAQEQPPSDITSYRGYLGLGVRAGEPLAGRKVWDRELLDCPSDDLARTRHCAESPVPWGGNFWNMFVEAKDGKAMSLTIRANGRVSPASVLEALENRYFPAIASYTVGGKRLKMFLAKYYLEPEVTPGVLAEMKASLETVFDDGPKSGPIVSFFFEMREMSRVRANSFGELLDRGDPWTRVTWR